MLRVTLLAALFGALLGAGAALAGTFKTPSGNIVCGWSGPPYTSVECGIKSGLKPAPKPIHCTAGDPNDKPWHRGLQDNRIHEHAQQHTVRDSSRARRTIGAALQRGIPPLVRP